jgi:hypothetical protein
MSLDEAGTQPGGLAKKPKGDPKPKPSEAQSAEQRQQSRQNREAATLSPFPSSVQKNTGRADFANCEVLHTPGAFI